MNPVTSALPALLLAATTAFAAPLAVERGPERPIEPHFIGFNQNFMGQTDPWDDALVDRLRTTGAANFRYPAGTVGSYWNWHTGRVDETLAPEDVMNWIQPHVRGGPRAGEGRYTLDNFQRALDGAEVAPVFMLGMAVHDLDEQVAILKDAERQGIPIRYLELGNEIIFQDAEPLLERLFPDAETYGRVATEWIQRLRHEFPEATIAVCGTFVSSDSQSERRRTWNPRMLSTLRGADTITTHLYAGEIIRTEQERLGLSEVQAQQALTAEERRRRDLAPTPANARLTIGLAYEVWDKLLAKSEVPADMDLWVTEWSTGGMAGNGDNWQTGLVTAALLDAFLRTRVTLTNHHTMGSVFQRPAGARRNPDNPGDGGATTPSLNATGLVLREFSHATRGLTRAAELRLPDAPVVTLPTGRSYAGVVGWAFADPTDGDRRALLVNLTAQAVEVRPADLALPAGTTARILAGSPDATPADLTPVSQPLGDSLTLPAFSLTLLARP